MRPASLESVAVDSIQSVLCSQPCRELMIVKKSSDESFKYYIYFKRSPFEYTCAAAMSVLEDDNFKLQYLLGG